MYKTLIVVTCFLLSTVVAAEEKLVDPTRPIGYAVTKKKVQTLKLQAIFFGNGREEAIVNGVFVKVGDKVHGKKIVSIKKDSVIYETNGLRRMLQLRPSIFKK